MALFRTLIWATASQRFPEGTDAAAVLLATATLTNDYIARIHGRANMFASAFLGILDAGTGALLYVNAGHDPPLIADAEGSRRRLGLTGPALWLLAEQRFTVGVTQLHVGDLLLGYTDGVVEAAGSEGAFGESRLRRRCATCRARPMLCCSGSS
jgi:sigma-B regulation protein RsbU (phosphoserine phosphatase)